jgi:nicotinate-nucleotide adenylyltransferase
MDGDSLNFKNISQVLFGGTFDPPHMGHRHCLETALRRIRPQRVKIIPSFNCPNLNGVSGQKQSASFAHRLAMCQLAFGELAVTNRDIEIEWMSIEQEIQDDAAAPSYAIDTLKALQRTGVLPQGGARETALLIGLDQAIKFHLWKDYQKILALPIHLLVVPRRLAATSRGETGFHEVTSINPLVKSHALILEDPDHPANSTEIRETCALANAAFAKAWLDPLILEYITKNKLYGAKDEPDISQPSQGSGGGSHNEEGYPPRTH